MALARVVVTVLVAVLGIAGSAPAAGLEDPRDQWLPRVDDATWTYQWSNSEYQPTPIRERYKVESRGGTAFRLRWDQVDPSPYQQPTAGTVDFRNSEAGLVNLNYQSTQPPPQFPVLCASASECGNSLAGAMYMVIWGTRSPTLAEPLVRGTRWNSVGGAANDVASANRYIGRENVKVPAFPTALATAKVESDVTQAGAIGDPFGSGVRTVWWVRGVGPIKVEFRHAGGEVSVAELAETNLTPLPLPPQDGLLPLNRGDAARFRWRNSRHMKAWSYQRAEVTQVVNSTSRVEIKHLRGPINVAGSYTFSTRLSGVTHLEAFTRAQTRAKFPQLGPARVPRGDRRHFFTPYDLMVYGFGPIVPGYAESGDTWRSSRDSRDFKVFGVTGESRVGKPRRIRVAKRRVLAFPVTTTLSQAGFRFGSGTRTSWFAPGRGLVKLTFRHRDRSVSTVERVG